MCNVTYDSFFQWENKQKFQIEITHVRFGISIKNTVYKNKNHPFKGVIKVNKKKMSY